LKQHHTGWFVIIAAILVALWLLLTKSGQAVTHGVSSVALTGTDPLTGAPLFNPSSPPPGTPVAPITGNLNDPVDNYPANPALASCPQGYALFKDAISGAYQCYPVSG
jgi:hypothetical protein